MSLQSIMSEHRVTVCKGAVTVGPTGALNRDWPETRELVCRVAPLSPTAAARMSQAGFAASHEVYSIQRPDVDERDVLLWIDKAGVEHRLEVAAPQRDPHGLGRFYIVYCREVSP